MEEEEAEEWEWYVKVRDGVEGSVLGFCLESRYQLVQVNGWLRVTDKDKHVGRPHRSVS